MIRRRVSVTAVLLAFLAVSAAPAGAQGGPEIGVAIDAAESVMNVSGTNGSGVLDTPRLGFPVAGDSYTWLATGSPATLIGEPGDFVSDGSAGVSDGLLKLELAPPENASCLAFDFIFMSEEYPEWVGSRFDDVFIAQLGPPDVTVSTRADGAPEVVAPGNFAFDEKGNQISVNTVFGMSSYPGIRMNGATPMLSAFSPIVPGQPVTLSLTLKDVSDAIFDSAVFVDNLRFFPGDCKAGSSTADEYPYGRNPTIEPATTKFECDGKGDVTISGSGFAHGVELEIYVYSTPTLLGTVGSSGDGTFEATVRIPELEAGSHTLVVEDGYGNRAEYECACLGSSSAALIAAPGRPPRTIVTPPAARAAAAASTGQTAPSAEASPAPSSAASASPSAQTGASIWSTLLVGFSLIVGGLWLRSRFRRAEVRR